MIEGTILLKSAITGKTTVLGTVRVINDGSGTLTQGNYSFGLSRRGGKSVWKAGRIVGFPRKRKNMWDLLYRVLDAAVGERNKSKPGSMTSPVRPKG